MKLSLDKPVLIGICTINRPKTTRRCLEALLASDHIESMQIVVVDNGSNEETRKVLKEFEPHLYNVVYNDWNTGVAFGVNRWMALRDQGQHCVQMDADCIIVDKNWLEPFIELINQKDVAVVAAHRATAWIDSGPPKLDYFRHNIKVEKRGDIWCEVPTDNTVLTPLMMYKYTLIEHIGYQNEVTNYDDLDYAIRVNCTGLKSLYATDVLIKQPRDEIQDHPQYGAHKSLMAIRERLFNKYRDDYIKRAQVYCGNRFIPGSIRDEFYQSMSDANWEYFKEYHDDPII